MAIRILKPTSAGRRFQTILAFDEITKTRPEKGLVVTKKRTGGRNALGRITTRHIGGGHKRKIRLIDFRREKFGVPAKVAAIEYDPNRSARIALLHYRDGEKRYILAPHGLRVADTVVSLVARVRTLCESKVKVLVLLALSDGGTPSYDHQLAAQLTALGAYCFGCTPKLLVRVVERIMKNQDPAGVIAEDRDHG